MKVTTGFSKPYVAKYSNTNGVTTYTGGMKAGRGVSVNISPESSDANIFYADNGEAENVPGIFTGGSATLTIDGLEQEAEAMIMGTGEVDKDGWIKYDDDQTTPFLGFGCIRRRLGGGKVTFQAMVLPKVSAEYINDEANTQEDSIDFQTTEITLDIKRDDTAKHEWKRLGKDVETEAEAEEMIKKFLGITTTAAAKSAS